jgi:hypothetical protein
MLLSPSAPEAISAIQFTQSSLQTTATPIVCSVYAVKSSAFFLHLFLVLPCPESQSLTRATPQVHQQCLPLIPPSPIALTCTFPLAIYFSKSLPSPSIYRCCRLFTITTCLLSFPIVSASAASAAVHRCLSLPLVLHHQKQN